jgi:hypothetical protein
MLCLEEISMSKMYGGLYKETSGKVFYRNIWILDMIPNKGFYVLVQDRLWTESSPTPVWESEPSVMLFPTHQEAVVEADKNYADSLKEGFRPIHESY